MTKAKARVGKKTKVRAKRAPVRTKVVKVIRRAPRRQMPSGAGRALLNGVVPRSRMSVQGEGDHLVLTGVDVVSQIITSDGPVVSQLNLNPVSAQLFPKLSGFALQYEKYRFRKIRLCYNTACPATRSGLFGMLIGREYLSPGSIPTSIPDFAAYQHSAVGSVAENFCTPWMTSDSKTFFYIPSNFAAQSDPLVVFQHTVGFIVRDSVPADSSLLGGYLSIEYEVEFVGLKGTRQRVLAASNSVETSCSATGDGSGANNTIIDLNPNTSSVGSGILNAIGDWGFEKAKEYLNGIDWGAAVDKWLVGNVPVGTYALEFQGSVGAVTALVETEYETVLPGRSKQKFPVTPMKISSEFSDPVIYYNPKFVKKPASWWNAMPQDEKTGKFSHPETPAVAGQFTVLLNSIDVTTGDPVGVLSWTYTPGTGAYSFEQGCTFTFTGPTALYFAVQIPTGGENRVIAADDFQYALVPMNSGT